MNAKNLGILYSFNFLLLIITILLSKYDFNDSKIEYESLQKKLEDKTKKINDFFDEQNNDVNKLKNFDEKLCNNPILSNLKKCNIFNLSEGEGEKQ